MKLTLVLCWRLSKAFATKMLILRCLLPVLISGSSKAGRGATISSNKSSSSVPNDWVSWTLPLEFSFVFGTSVLASVVSSFNFCFFSFGSSSRKFSLMSDLSFCCSCSTVQTNSEKLTRFILQTLQIRWGNWESTSSLMRLKYSNKSLKVMIPILSESDITSSSLLFTAQQSRQTDMILERKESKQTIKAVHCHWRGESPKGMLCNIGKTLEWNIEHATDCFWDFSRKLNRRKFQEKFKAFRSVFSPTRFRALRTKSWRDIFFHSFSLLLTVYP